MSNLSCKFSSPRESFCFLHRAMLPGAFLFVGHSETLTDHLDFFEQVRHGGILQYRKRGD